jgi:hypothetical protein
MDVDKHKLNAWLRDELSKSTGAEVSARLDWLDYCLFIFEENYKSIESYSSYAEQQNVAVQMFVNKDYSSKVQGTFVRHLHNFLVASKSLVEHTRGSIRAWYSGTDLLRKYQEQVTKTFAGDPLVSFIEDLRDYCVHKSPIEIITHHRIGEDEPSNSTYIHKESILHWSGLSAGGRQFLLQFQSDIPIMEPIIAYKDKVVGFRQWLRSELEEYHAKDIYEAKWYVQAISLAEMDDVEGLIRSGLNPSLLKAFARTK